MVVRIRFARGPRIIRARGRDRRLAGAASALLMLPAVMALVLAAWAIAAGMNWAGRFAVSTGFFSHWQAWLAFAALLQFIARMLSRYSRGAGSQ